MILERTLELKSMRRARPSLCVSWQSDYQGIDIEGNEVHAEVSGGEAISWPWSTPLDMPLGTFAGSADLASRSLENAQRRSA